MPHPAILASALAISLGLGLGCGLAGPATAQPAPQTGRAPLPQAMPNIQPTRDVAVTYRVQEGAQAPQTVQAAWLVGQRRLRVVTAAAPGWVLVDIPANRAVMVMEAQRVVLELPGGQVVQMLNQVPPEAKLTRIGADSVAGQACDQWRVQSPRGEGQVCLTRDGVVLRATGQRRGQNAVMEATSVSYDPQDPARFSVPAGFQSLKMPQNLPQGLLPR